MSKITCKKSLPFAKGFLALAVTGLMSGSVVAQNQQSMSSAAAGDSAASSNSQASQQQSGSASQALSSSADAQSTGAASTSGQSQEFQEMDQNRDNLLVWKELYVVLDPRIVAANLDQEQIFSEYDANSDDALDENEFQEFLSGLEQREYASTDSDNQQDMTSAAEGAGAESAMQMDANNSEGLDVTATSAHGADQGIVLPNDSRYNEAGTASTATVNPQRQSDAGLSSQAPREEQRQDEETILGQVNSEEDAMRTNSERETATQERAPMASETSRVGGSERSAVLADMNAEAEAQNQRQDGAQELQSVSIASLQKKTVKNSAGEDLGEVKEVVINRDRGEVGVVLTSGGVMGIGSKKLLAPADELSLSENELVWDTAKSSKELKESAKYQPDGYTEVSDEYDTIEEIRQAGL